MQRVNTYLMRWARKRYRRLRSFKRFQAWWTGVLDREPGLFKHWTWAREFEWTRSEERVTGGCHASFRGSPGVRFPGATRTTRRRPVQRQQRLAGLHRHRTPPHPRRRHPPAPDQRRRPDHPTRQRNNDPSAATLAVATQLATTVHRRARPTRLIVHNRQSHAADAGHPTNARPHRAV